MAKRPRACTLEICTSTHRSGNRTDGVLQSDGSMSVGTCIQHNAVCLETRLLNLVYQFSLDVGLKIINLYIGISFAGGGWRDTSGK